MRTRYTVEDTTCAWCSGPVTGHCCGEQVIYWCDDCGSNSPDKKPSIDVSGVKEHTELPEFVKRLAGKVPGAKAVDRLITLSKTDLANDLTDIFGTLEMDICLDLPRDVETSNKAYAKSVLQSVVAKSSVNTAAITNSAGETEERVVSYTVPNSVIRELIADLSAGEGKE